MLQVVDCELVAMSDNDSAESCVLCVCSLCCVCVCVCCVRVCVNVCCVRVCLCVCVRACVVSRLLAHARGRLCTLAGKAGVQTAKPTFSLNAKSIGNLLRLGSQFGKGLVQWATVPALPNRRRGSTRQM